MVPRTMTDVRARLRPKIYSGVPFKIVGAIEELVQANDPSLFDWILEGATVELCTQSRYFQWKYENTTRISHPVLSPSLALRVAAQAKSPKADALRAKLSALCLEATEDDGPLDVSSLRWMTELVRLRIHGYEIENLYEWRAEAASYMRDVEGIEALAYAKALEHLTVVSVKNLDLEHVRPLSALRYLEIAGCGVTDLSPLRATKLETLIVAACPHIETIDALPASLQHLHIEDLPDLASVEAIAKLTALKSLHVAGVPLKKLPNTKAKTVFSPKRKERESEALV